MDDINVNRGIIDIERNPFGRKSWIIQGYPLTLKRKNQLSVLFGKDTETIKKIRNINDGKYVAFVAIRWGFAVIIKGRLIATEKWTNQGNYDDFGQIKSSLY
jgi:hypothetical protein